MKKTNIIITSAILLSTVFMSTSQAGYVEPGSEADPLVSKTYVDKGFSDAKKNSDINKEKLEKIEQKMEKLEAMEAKLDKALENNPNNQNAGEKFKVLELKKGETILAEESTEIIVRSGVVNAVGSENGGLSDITQGVDLKSGQQIKVNHLIIVPRSDGRGIEVKSNDTFIMIKGGYKII